MAESGAKRSSPLSLAPEDDGPSEAKKQKIEVQIKPPHQYYKDIRKLLRSLSIQASKRDKDIERINKLLAQLMKLLTETPTDGELSPAAMVAQMHLKNASFNSEGIKDGDNIKTFLNGLEDGSEGKSDRDENVYVFYANHATALWYRWNEAKLQWEWTPESEWWLWMPCSTTEVTDGQWKGEVPAPENVEIIRYLDVVRPAPSDEGYLSDQFDVGFLLKELAKVEDVKKKVVSVAKALRDHNLPSSNEHWESFKKTLASFMDISQ